MAEMMTEEEGAPPDLPRLKRPLIEDREAEVDPSQAPAVPDLAGGRAMQGVGRMATRQGSAFGRLAAWVFGGLFTLVLSVAAWNFVTGLFAANPVLGWVAFVLLMAALAVALVVVVAEMSAFARLARLDRIRAEAVQAGGAADLRAARLVVAQVVRLYASRPETAAGRARLADRQAEVMDADALLVLAETEVLAPLDAAALAQVEAAARRVATVTAQLLFCWR